ncbi:MAG TPA: hypothetical protein VF245_11980 [Solirubrobacterales bacterium]
MAYALIGEQEIRANWLPQILTSQGDFHVIGLPNHPSLTDSPVRRSSGHSKKVLVVLPLPGDEETMLFACRPKVAL